MLTGFLIVIATVKIRTYILAHALIHSCLLYMDYDWYTCTNFDLVGVDLV